MKEEEEEEEEEAPFAAADKGAPEASSETPCPAMSEEKGGAVEDTRVTEKAAGPSTPASCPPLPCAASPGFLLPICSMPSST
jgi:hypothetical protein